MEGEEAAWEDLEQIYAPAADAGELPLRLYSFVPLPTWCAGAGCMCQGWARVDLGLAAFPLPSCLLPAAEAELSGGG